ncbi:Adenylate isopentenyltransferase 5, chloroplastic [Linum perenne]
MDGDAPAATLQNPNPESEVPATTREHRKEQKPKIVVIMGATGAGKSKLAVDLAAHFPIEIINADSMQVYRGLDVLTNKVPVDEQKGVPHHLLGTVNPNVEFTAKEFRDSALHIINDIRSRNCVPVVVGGTNYYIQVGFDCCFICVDASVSVLDHYVDQRVDCMIDAGLLDEVYYIYNTEADYTRGLRQAIGVREFEDFLRVYLSEPLDTKVINTVDQNTEKDKLMEILQSPDDNSLKVLLTEAIAKVKMNTRRLVRRQVSSFPKFPYLLGYLTVNTFL